MDYKGQQWCENLYYIIVILFGVVSWIVGYIDDNFYTAVYGWLIGLGIAVIVCVPDWPWFNRSPVQWLPELPDRSKGPAAAKKPKGAK